MARSRAILCATDFSTASRPALTKAVELAKSGKAELVVLHVLVSPVAPFSTGNFAFPQAYVELEVQLRREAERKMRALGKRLKKTGVRVTPVVVRGIPVQDIVRLARSKRAGMVVMGTHGRTGISRFMMGSVAARVVATAPCPVLTVRSS